MPQSKPPLLFAGRSHQELAEKICVKGSIQQGKVQIETFPDGEIGVRILENVHGRDVFVLQTIAHHPHLYLMELFIMVDALKRAGAREVTAVIPYLGYARQDRRDRVGEPISAKVVASLLETVGVSRILTMDLHTPQIEGFFNIPLMHLTGQPLLAQEMIRQKWEGSVMVAPDHGSVKRARQFATALHTRDGIVSKQRMSASCVESHAFAGDIVQQDVVLVDDLYSTGQTMAIAAEVCRRAGARKIYGAVTHGLFVAGRFEERVIEKMMVTDTIALPTTLKSDRVEVVSVAPLFAEAIQALC